MGDVLWVYRDFVLRKVDVLGKDFVENVIYGWYLKFE